MMLHTELYEDDLEKHLNRGRQRAFWRSYLAARTQLNDELPSVDAVCGEQIRELNAWMSRLQRLPDGDFLYTHHGEELAMAMGRSWLGQRASNCQDQACRFFLKSYRHVAETELPIVTVSNEPSGGKVASWKSLLVPAIDGAGQLNIIALLRPVEREQAIMSGLLDIIDDPVLVLQMIRNGGQDVIDARILQLNAPAEQLLKIDDVRHLHVSDCAPQLLQEPMLPMIRKAYSESRKGKLNEPFVLGDQAFRAAIATPNADGAVVRLIR